jgi:hypothetical protein
LTIWDRIISGGATERVLTVKVVDFDAASLEAFKVEKVEAIRAGKLSTAAADDLAPPLVCGGFAAAEGKTGFVGVEAVLRRVFFFDI